MHRLWHLNCVLDARRGEGVPLSLVHLCAKSAEETLDQTARAPMTSITASQTAGMPVL